MHGRHSSDAVLFSLMRRNDASRVKTQSFRSRWSGTFVVRTMHNHMISHVCPPFRICPPRRVTPCSTYDSENVYIRNCSERGAETFIACPRSAFFLAVRYCVEVLQEFYFHVESWNRQGPPETYSRSNTLFEFEVDSTRIDFSAVRMPSKNRRWPDRCSEEEKPVTRSCRTAEI